MSWDQALFEGLTEAQIEAVRHLDGPLLVLAGPGSGKTTVVTRRVANLVANGIPPWQILALTFTNKAAGEMRDRIAALLPPDMPGLRGLTVTTFHSFSARLLRRYADAAGRTPGYTIYDSRDQRDALKRAILAAQLSQQNWPLGAVATAISQAKNRLESPQAFSDAAGDFNTRTIARIYREYDRILVDADAVDFDDLLRLTADLLRRAPMARQELCDRYRYLLIDEYQDTNHAQFVIAHQLASEHRNICVVGDPDQSIYGWRGADIANILDFETQYGETRIIPLGQNFRSTGHIVDAAAALIEHNQRRKPKRLFTELGPGARPRVIATRDERHEAEQIAQTFRTQFESGTPWREMAVLYRINALSRVLEDVLRREAIPYVIARGTAFYERKEVKDALAYLRIVANPRDEISLRRIINVPPRGIGKTSLQRVEAEAIRRGVSLLEALLEARAVEGVSTRAAAAIDKFLTLLDGWRQAAVGESGDLLAGTSDLGALVDRVVCESGLDAAYRNAKVEEERDKLANLEELVSAAAEFEPRDPDDPVDPVDPDIPPAEPTPLDVLRGFLESITLVSDADMVDPERGAVTLMTLHTAKGLEFDVVAIAGLEAGLLPHNRSVGNDDELEEERRLCFVGITRARRHLLLTLARMRTVRGIRERTIPSSFLSELPEDAIEHEDLSTAMHDPFLEEPAWTASYERDTTEGGYYVGCMVRHPTFGVGRIASVTARPRGSAARVLFDRVGEKTLILEYAKLEMIKDV